MREHKYRAWDKKNKEYIEIIGFYYSDDHIVLWFIDGVGIPNYKHFHVKGIILEQYTGLKDKNGKEIYEGDIIHSQYRGHTIKISIGESKYIGCGVGLYGVMAEFLIPKKDSEPFMYNSGRMDWEIIGTIHD